MSNYYKPNRGADWNYGGKNFRVSRSKIDLFMECPRCFYLDNKLGVARPPGFPFSLNSAVDELLKREFDGYRAKKEAHPLMKAYGLDAVPYPHAELDAWRDALRRGISCLHKKTGLTIRGAVDDVWRGKDGNLIIVDYKATSKKGEVSLDAEWQDGYKRQMEVYQWLFRQNGFPVSDTGYFVYVNADSDKEAFDAKLEFKVKLIPYTGSDKWVDDAIMALHQCLLSGEVPKAAPGCDYCTYRAATEKAEKSAVAAPKKEGKVAEKKSAKTLF